ncbi:MAG: sensor histidine kinase [Chloroflexota bacterium]
MSLRHQAVIYLLLVALVPPAVAAGYSITYADTVTETITAFLIAAVAAAGLGVVSAYRLTGPALRLREAADLKLAGDIASRTLLDGPPELRRVAEALNSVSDHFQELLQLEGSERVRLSSVLNTMTDGVLVVDSEGTVELINPAASNMLDAPASFRPGERLVTINRDHQLLSVILECATRRAPRQAHTELLGSRRYVSVVAVPLGEQARDSHRTPSDRNLVLVLLTDLTEMRRVEVTRTEFVANASHELRTPLAAIRSSAETLEMGALRDPDAAQGFLSRIQDNIARMESIINEMLELSRLESGAAPIHLAPLDLRELVMDEVDRLQPVADRSGVEMQVHAPDDLPHVTADYEKVCRVVDNLVSNALKAVDDGGRVTVSLDRCESGVRLRVSDNGEGIDPEHLPHVFERFFKADSSRSSSGTGLGLAIVKHIAQVHGGDARVESRLGEGATFSVTFPVNTGFDEASPEHASGTPA